jgi:hypothetical protein
MQELKQARVNLGQLQEQMTRLQEQLPAYAHLSVSVPHIRALESRDGYVPAPAPALEAELMPLLGAGLCGGNAHQLRRSMIAVNIDFDKFAREAAWSGVPPEGGLLPSAPFYPDEIGKWTE